MAAPCKSKQTGTKFQTLSCSQPLNGKRCRKVRSDLTNWTDDLTLNVSADSLFHLDQATFAKCTTLINFGRKSEQGNTQNTRWPATQVLDRPGSVYHSASNPMRFRTSVLQLPQPEEHKTLRPVVGSCCPSKWPQAMGKSLPRINFSFLSSYTMAFELVFCITFLFW